MSAITYAGERVEFSEAEFLGHTKEAVLANNIKANEVDVKNDLIEALSFITRDGFELRYSHRSFQEYFCAHYISMAADELSAACIRAVQDRADTDNVLLMAYGLNGPKMESIWLTAEVAKLFSVLSNLHRSGRFFELFTSAFTALTFSKISMTFHVGGTESSRAFSAIFRCMEERSSTSIKSCHDFYSFIGEGQSRDWMVRALINGLPDSAVGLIDRIREALFNAEVFPKDNVYTIRRIDEKLRVTAEHPIWKICSDELLGMVADWTGELERRKQARTSSALRLFEHSARNAWRSLPQ